MNKLDIATQILLKLIETNERGYDSEGIASYAWEIADAMQTEADKRNKAEAEEKRKYIRELLNADNTFIEKEGQHFDDVEWQPDWSKAPKDKPITEWQITEIGKPVWIWYSKGSPIYIAAPSFDYQGDWKQSLRKRPHEA